MYKRIFQKVKIFFKTTDHNMEQPLINLKLIFFGGVSP